MRRHPSFRATMCAIVLCFLAAGAVSAAPQELPAAEDIIARYVVAIGGADAIRANDSVHSTGTIEVLGQGLSGTMEIFAAAPDRTLLIVNFAGLGIETRQGFNGEVAWSTDPMTGERVLQGPERQQIVDESDFYSDLHEASKYESMETLEITEFGGRSAYKVKLVYVSGRETLEYFDVETGRLVGMENEQHSLMGVLKVRTFASDYQQFGELTIPTTIVQEFGPGQSMQITILSVEFGGVDASTFALPASIAALIR